MIQPRRWILLARKRSFVLFPISYTRIYGRFVYVREPKSITCGTRHTKRSGRRDATRRHRICCTCIRLTFKFLMRIPIFEDVTSRWDVEDATGIFMYFSLSLLVCVYISQILNKDYIPILYFMSISSDYN